VPRAPLARRPKHGHSCSSRKAPGRPPLAGAGARGTRRGPHVIHHAADPRSHRRNREKSFRSSISVANDCGPEAVDERASSPPANADAIPRRARAGQILTVRTYDCHHRGLHRPRQSRPGVDYLAKLRAWGRRRRTRAKCVLECVVFCKCLTLKWLLAGSNPVAPTSIYAGSRAARG